MKTSPNLLFLDTYLVIPNAELENVHPLIKRLYSKEMLTKAVDIPLAGRISHAIVNWKKLTLKQDILSKGLHLTIYQHTFSTKKSQFVVNEQEANCSCGFRIKDVEERGNKANSACSWEFLNNLFLVGKKRRKLSPSNQSKNVELVHVFLHFKMEGLSHLKHLIQEADWMNKLDLKDDACFSVPLDQDSRKFVRFLWKETLYELICLCFGLGPSPWVFTKL